MMECAYLLTEAVNILLEDNIPYNQLGYRRRDIMNVLEDANSPVNRKYHEKLFQSVIDKKHINFGSIEKSRGNIKEYEGYPNMIEVLDVLEKLAVSEKSDDVLKYTKVVKTAIDNIVNLSSTYTVVEATTTLLYEFIDYVKRPDMVTMKITLKNNKTRANLFYFEQLEKFNNVIDKMGIEYRKMLENLCAKGKNNFIGVDEMIGITAISVVAFAIIPITRELIYQFYRLRGNIATSLEMQAKFLEMNEACLKANDALQPEKKKEIISKQKKMATGLSRLAEKIKVKTNKSLVSAKKELTKQNKMLSIDNIQDEIGNSPLEMM